MLNHVMLGSNDIDRSKRFYDAVLGLLGAGEPIVAEEQDALVPHRLGHPFTFSGRVRDAVEVVVIGDFAIESGAVLMDHQKPAALDGGDRRRIGRVEMHHHLRVGMQKMHAGVDVEAADRRATDAFHGDAMFVDHQQAARRDALEPQPLWIHKEAAAGQHHRNVVADAFMHGEARRRPEDGGEIDAGLLRFGGVVA